MNCSRAGELEGFNGGFGRLGLMGALSLGLRVYNPEALNPDFVNCAFQGRCQLTSSSACDHCGVRGSVGAWFRVEGHWDLGFRVLGFWHEVASGGCLPELN